MIELVDVLTDKNAYSQLISYVQQVVLNDKHYNSSNYNFLLNEDLKDFYYRFTILKENNNIISIQGIRHSFKYYKYPATVARIADRHYVDKNYRISHIGKRKSYYSDYVLDSDIDFIKKNTQVENIFFSIQGTRGLKHFFRNQLTIEKFKNHQFQTDEWFYQTCGDKNNKLCWQNCFYLNLTTSKFNLPKISKDEWNQLDG